jgi:hypothetical protein
MALLESDLQEAIFTWASTVERNHPELRWLHAVPNGGLRSGREAVSLKRQGVKAGILDIHLPVARCGFHGLMIELKSPGGKCKSPSLEQLEYIVFLTCQGYYAKVSNDFDEVKNIILEYLNSGTNA